MSFANLFNEVGGRALGGLLGAGLSYLVKPKAPTYAPPAAPPQIAQTPSAAQLDAATLPYLRQKNQLRLAQLLARQGQQGGMGSSDLFESAALRQQQGLSEGVQSGQNVLQALNAANVAAQQDYNNRVDYNNAVNNIANSQYANRRQGLKDIISGGLLGANIAAPDYVQQQTNILRQILANQGINGNVATNSAYSDTGEITPVYDANGNFIGYRS